MFASVDGFHWFAFVLANGELCGFIFSFTMTQKQLIWFESLNEHFFLTCDTYMDIPLSKISASNRCNTSWFNNECKQAIKLRNAALHKLKKEPLTSYLNSFKLLREKARRTIKEAKKISWQNYINKLNSSTKKKIQSGKWSAKFLAKTSLLHSNAS